MCCATFCQEFHVLLVARSVGQDRHYRVTAARFCSVGLESICRLYRLSRVFFVGLLLALRFA